MYLCVKHPGLRKRTGSWCITKGVFRPVIYIDPQTPTGAEFNFMVQHEVCHAREKHALWGILLLLTVAGAFLYLPYRRWCEIRADRSATRVFGRTSLEIYCRMREGGGRRRSWLARYLYGRTSEERIARTMKGF